jgi:hypothetical protein
VTPDLSWLPAFPIKPATEAVDALFDGWNELASQPRSNFNPRTREPDLTKALKIYVETVTAPMRGVLGMWAAEDVFGEMDSTTGKVVKERRTDIVYGWNDETRAMKLVFEFKKLGRQKSHRKHYLQTKGLRRFVDGIYSRHEPVAAMVGVLLDPRPDVVPPLTSALADTALASGLRLRQANNGQLFFTPSALFANAEFDTEHERDPGLAPSHGTIRVAHFFFEFGYPVTTVKSGSTVASGA